MTFLALLCTYILIFFSFADKQVLVAHLADLGLKIIDTIGDGTCAFQMYSVAAGYLYFIYTFIYTFIIKFDILYSF